MGWLPDSRVVRSKSDLYQWNLKRVFVAFLAQNFYMWDARHL